MSSVEDRKIHISIVDDYGYGGGHKIGKIVGKHCKDFIYKGRIEEPAGYCSDPENTENFVINEKDSVSLMKELKELGFYYRQREAILIHRWD